MKDKSTSPDPASSFTWEQLLQMTQRLQTSKDWVSYRNLALIQVGFFSGLTCEELLRIRWENVMYLNYNDQWHHLSGLEITYVEADKHQNKEKEVCYIQRFKDGFDHIDTLNPYNALANWHAKSGLKKGPVFCHLSDNDQALNITDVNNMIQSLTKACNFSQADHYNAASLRKTFETIAPPGHRQEPPFGELSYETTADAKHRIARKLRPIARLLIQFEELAKTSTSINDIGHTLDLISNLGTPRHVAPLIKHIVSYDDALSQKVAITIEQLMSQKQNQQRWSTQCVGYNNCQFHDPTLECFQDFPAQQSVHLYGIASFHADINVRQKALTFLQNLTTPDTLPYLILRLNDRAPQIQALAKTALFIVLPKIKIPDLITHYKMIEWLESPLCDNSFEIKNKIIKYIVEKGRTKSLYQTIKKSPTMERFFYWRAVAEAGKNDRTLMDTIITDPAAEIRAWAVSQLIHPDGIDPFLSDPSSRVRYAALKKIPQTAFKHYQHHFESALYDDSHRVRAYARFMRRHNGKGNCLSMYRNKLRTPGNNINPGIIAGFTEVGTQDDLPLIKRFFSHRNVKVRVAVLTALCRLSASDANQYYLQGLQDNSVAVRKMCRTMLKTC